MHATFVAHIVGWYRRYVLHVLNLTKLHTLWWCIFFLSTPYRPPSPLLHYIAILLFAVKFRQTFLVYLVVDLRYCRCSIPWCFSVALPGVVPDCYCCCLPLCYCYIVGWPFLYFVVDFVTPTTLQYLIYLFCISLVVLVVDIGIIGGWLWPLLVVVDLILFIFSWYLLPFTFPLIYIIPIHCCALHYILPLVPYILLFTFVSCPHCQYVDWTYDSLWFCIYGHFCCIGSLPDCIPTMRVMMLYIVAVVVIVVVLVVGVDSGSFYMPYIVIVVVMHDVITNICYWWIVFDRYSILLPSIACCYSTPLRCVVVVAPHSAAVACMLVILPHTPFAGGRCWFYLPVTFTTWSFGQTGFAPGRSAALPVFWSPFLLVAPDCSRCLLPCTYVPVCCCARSLFLYIGRCVWQLPCYFLLLNFTLIFPIYALQALPANFCTPSHIYVVVTLLPAAWLLVCVVPRLFVRDGRCLFAAFPSCYGPTRCCYGGWILPVYVNLLLLFYWPASYFPIAFTVYSPHI